jgi:hypothetical protein
MSARTFKVDTCGSCHRPIIWAMTINAKPMPVDAEPPLSGGNVELEWRAGGSPIARVLPVAKQFGKHDLRLPHHATCPQGATWRKRKVRPS